MHSDNRGDGKSKLWQDESLQSSEAGQVESEAGEMRFMRGRQKPKGARENILWETFPAVEMISNSITVCSGKVKFQTHLIK